MQILMQNLAEILGFNKGSWEMLLQILGLHFEYQEPVLPDLLLWQEKIAIRLFSIVLILNSHAHQSPHPSEWKLITPLFVALF